ncbi:MAG: DNA polymerase Y family protein [Betaproteobacteria bacterium]
MLRGTPAQSQSPSDPAPLGPAVITSGGNRPHIVSCNPAARRHGIAPGMTVSAAIALAPELIERVRDTAAEQRALEGAAAWAGQFTSTVSLLRPDALLLEIQGSQRLFGGLQTLLLRLAEEVNEIGYTAALALAPTPTAARLLARSGMGSTITDSAALEKALYGIPLSMLQQSAETVRMLDIMGVHTLGECLQLPRDGVARRFGQALIDEMDRALGRLPDPVTPWIAPSRYKSKLVLPAPVHNTEPLLFAANRLIQELTGFLCMKQAGITRLKLTLHHEDRKPTAVVLGLSVPSRDAPRISRLLRERLGTITLPDRVEAITLETTEARPLDSRNLSLFPEDRLPDEQRWLIIEHLRARLGDESVYSIATHGDHRPELAWRCCEPGTAVEIPETNTRPLWLLEPAQRLRSDDAGPVLDHPLTLLAGPERIESGWWDDAAEARDYFVAADADGRRFWIFQEREPTPTWFLHGVFA